MPGPVELGIILVIVLILFGAGKLPQVMEAFGTGIKRFREAQSEDPEDVTPPSKPAKQIDQSPDVSEAEEVSETSKAAGA